MSATAVFREIAERIPAYNGLRYPLLKDETRPVQAKHEVFPEHAVTQELRNLEEHTKRLPDNGVKETDIRDIGHELFRIGTLTDKVPQFHLLAAGNPRPETVRVSPLYQITVDASLQREAAATAE